MWKLPEFETRTSVNGDFDVEIVGIFQDSGKKAVSPKEKLSEVLEALKKKDVFNAKLGSQQFIRFSNKTTLQSVLFVGLGLAAELSLEKIRSIGGNVWSKLLSEKCKTVQIDCQSWTESKNLPTDLKPLQILKAFAEGLILNAYQFDSHKSSRQDSAGSSQKSSKFPSKIVFSLNDKSLKVELERELENVKFSAEAIRVTRDWSNEPSNFGTPEYYADEAKKLSRQYGLKCRILGKSEAEKEKMGLFLGVGQGSVREGKVVILEYQPSGKSNKNLKTIALVGKGVTFDSGGISIKPSARMEEMKHDMTGAATVMGATLLAARMKVPHRILTIMVFTENMPDGNAIQPGNILTARNGKTVEIINTDAEGRLILADALDYIQDSKPDAIIDVATLTGAVSIALGKHCCAVLGNDEKLIRELRAAGEGCGERIWELPLFDEYFDDLKSDYADMKNSANDSYGGTIRGAIFLKQFIRNGMNWAHLDIAATAYNLGHLSYIPKRGASGAYVRTLAQFISEY